MPAFSYERGFRFFGWLQVSLVVLHYGMDLANLLSPAPHQSVPWWIARFACVCSLAGLVLGLAMIKGNARLATYGLVLWLLYPMGSMVFEMTRGNFIFELGMANHFSMLLIGPLCIVSGFWILRDIPLAIGVSQVLFFLKGMVNYLFGGPELQILLVQIIGEHTMKDHFLAVNLIGLASSIFFVVPGWLLLRGKRGG